MCKCVNKLSSLTAGERHATLNIHYLLHIVDMVRDLEPLWANTCFEFENANGTHQEAVSWHQEN